jgi:sugar O-acyltransferase (sialic acid O-acetyltransferase NeuD family)
MSRLLILGAKGFAKELLEVVLQIDPCCDVTFFDDVSADVPDRLFGQYRVVVTKAAAKEYFDNVDRDFAIGVGKPELRRKFFSEFVDLGGKPKTVISPHAKIGIIGNQISEGTCVLTDAILESNNKIGIGCLIHVGALISHDVRLGDFCEVSPRANLLGGVTIGADCSMGTGSTVLPRITIGSKVTVGAGAVVTKNFPDDCTVIGVPARLI